MTLIDILPTIQMSVQPLVLLAAIGPITVAVAGLIARTRR